jgi:hypothetical protein
LKRLLTKSHFAKEELFSPAPVLNEKVIILNDAIPERKARPTVITEMNSSLEETKNKQPSALLRSVGSDEDMSYSLINESQVLDTTINQQFS